MSIEFTLFYNGPLKANGNPKQKHSIRQTFHPQLKTLWTQEPLCNFNDFISTETSGNNTLICKRGKFVFAPLVSHALHLAAEIDVTLLRPEPPGAILSRGGDLDNRLKTLFDALKVPAVDEIPKREFPQEGEDPFFCLLEDDKLITRVSVDTAQWLGASEEGAKVVMLVHVLAKKLSTLMGGMELP